MAISATDSDLTVRAERDGYFLVEDLLDNDECEQFASRLHDYAAGERPLPDGVSLQREPAVVRSGRDTEPGGDVRKISGLFGDDLFRTLISRPSVTTRLNTLLGAPLRLFRADALMKPAAVGSQKGVHQDSPYWPIEPMSLWSCWVPFDDAAADNGCLVVAPGSHRGGPAPHVSTQDDFVIPTEHHDPAGLVEVPMRRGTGLFFHSLLVHGSAANTSGRPRRAVTMSYFGPRHRFTGEGEAPSYPLIG
ncbi:phytanoyl-CoA dioxygenase family protein [Actinopolymorpha sp. B11F2]|uniref:phytanoyl-CoA dioxygenase family protein n=1 Tax=Actinopolymorpha sp. B11F2 TaxID=3160862 RepID=UPI0032E51FA4